MSCEEIGFVCVQGASGSPCSALLHSVDKKQLQNRRNHRPEYISSLCNNSGDLGTFDWGLQQSTDRTEQLNWAGENAFDAVHVLILSLITGWMSNSFLLQVLPFINSRGITLLQKMSGSVWEVVSKNISDNCFLLVGGFILEHSERRKEWKGCSQGKPQQALASVWCYLSVIADIFNANCLCLHLM